MKKRSLIKGFLREFNAVKGDFAKPKARQLIEVLQLMLRCQYTPDEYFYYSFYEQDKDYSYMLNFISNFASLEDYHPLMHDPGWEHILENKLLFNIYFRQYGLPVTMVYGYYDRNAGFAFDGSRLTDPEDLRNYLLKHKPSSLVVKPVGGNKGSDVLVLNKIKYTRHQITGYRKNGSIVSFGDLEKHLGKVHCNLKYKGFLLEKILEQHTLLNDINPDAVNTVRIVTLLGKNRRVTVPLAILRLGRTGSDVDNVSKGGLIVGIDIGSGTLGNGKFYTEYGNGLHQVHPDTGVPFTGKKIPCWHELIALCCMAAEHAPFCRSVGWDLALTQGGPVLVEGNVKWAVNLQVHTKGFLTPAVRSELANYRLLFPQDKLPGIDVGRLVKALKMWKG